MDEPRTSLDEETLRLKKDAPPGALSLFALCENEPQTFRLPERGSVTLGRSADADLRLGDQAVSRRHLTLHFGDGVRLEDLGSANGTRVRGRDLNPGETVDLLPGDPVEIGRTLLVLQRTRLAPGRKVRLHSHDEFTTRLEEECGRAGRHRGHFGVARIHAPAQATLRSEERIAAEIRPGDVLGQYGPGEYEVLLVDCQPSLAKVRADAIARAVSSGEGTIKTGLASYPMDGTTATRLLERANSEVRGIVRDRNSEPPVLVQRGAMEALRLIVDRVAGSSISVLVTGETGVGKGVLAVELHRRSTRATKPFVALNCAELADSLLEAELFGYERGAFTGAARAKPGLIESADGGTLFLDEIGEMPFSTQAKLLRVLEDRQVRRLGSVRSKGVDIRVVSASSRDLESEVKTGAFRRDLYFRLNGISLVVPPLRDRIDEIGELARAFLERASREAGQPVPELSVDALAALRRYPWPGNVRELRNSMERAALLSSDGLISPEHLPADKPQTTLYAENRPVEERGRIQEALLNCAGNQSRAAKLLGISRRALVKRLDKYGLPRPRA